MYAERRASVWRWAFADSTAVGSVSNLKLGDRKNAC